MSGKQKSGQNQNKSGQNQQPQTGPAQNQAAAPPAPARPTPVVASPTTGSGIGRAQQVEQQRAGHAWEVVEQAAKLGEVERKQFGTHAKKLPMRIRAAGLGQALAFVNAKGRDKKGAEHLLYSINGWVLPRLGQGIGTTPDALIQAILRQDALFLRRATQEALAWLEWLNRFAEAKGLTKDVEQEDQ